MNVPNLTTVDSLIEITSLSPEKLILLANLYKAIKDKDDNAILYYFSEAVVTEPDSIILILLQQNFLSIQESSYLKRWWLSHKHYIQDEVLV